MAATGMPLPPQSELASLLDDLRAEAMMPVVSVLVAAGCLLMAGSARLPEPLHGVIPGLALYATPLAAWGLRQWRPRAGAWALVGGCVLVDLILVAWSGLGAALCLLAIPAGLAILSISMAAGVGVAALCTLLLWLAPAPWLPPDPSLRWVSAVALWSSVGMICLAVRPLLTTLQWSWSSYETSRRLLEEGRDYQVKLKQTLADLADANLQLTRLNRLTGALRQAAEEARRAKEEFVVNVSHELRTPLNMIIGFSEMIVRAPQVYGSHIPPALLADLSVILRNSQHLSGLIDDVLDLSQIEAGKMALTKERVTLAEIIEAAVIAVRPLYESKGLYLQAEVEENLPPVLCDRTRIREVLLNLLSNAGRFTEQGGVRVCARREDSQVVLSVTDTGPGIATADVDRMFQPFQQLDGSIRRRYGGSGLGLAISKSFVELHGGKMWLESRLATGTTFYFSLPIDPPAPMTESNTPRWFNPYWHYEERAHPSLAPVPAVRPRLVVLESGFALLRLLTRYMDGVEVVSVGTLEEGVQELGRVPSQALLVNSDSVGGALQALDQSATLPQGTPAIVCTVPGSQPARDDLGVADYLVKPVSREVLLTALERLHLQGQTVLVVDDEPEAVRLFQRMLSSAEPGYRVLRANNGEQALHVLRQHTVDVLLLDLVMPEMDGFRLLEVRSQDPALRRIPVIVLSARDPSGEPVVANALAVTRAGGLAVPQLLACIQALTRILSPAGPALDPAPPEKRAG